MKKVYLNFLPLLVALLTALPSQAGTWSYDWPVSATKDKNAGFYNLGSDKTLTTQTRTLNEREWTINVPEGCYLAFTTTSGQMVGKVTGGVLPVDAFNLVSGSFEGKIKSVTISSRTEATEAAVNVSVNGKAYASAATPASIAGKSLIEHVFTSTDMQEGEIKIEFTQTGATKPFYIKKITVEWEEEAPAFEAPALSVAEGTYDEAQTVSITAPEGCEVVYTTDGSNPRSSETAVVYSAPITINETMTLKAVARKDGVYGAVAVAKYVIRKAPVLSFEEQEFSIEWPDDGSGPYLNNPDRLTVTYKTDDPEVAYVDKFGWITTVKVGETTVRATFAGNDTYYPGEASYALHVVAKPPMDAPVITPDGGEFDEQVTVTFTATDERAQALWYTIGDTKPEIDEWGLLQDFEINHEPTMTRTFDENTTIWIQAVGDNIWSEVKMASFKVNQKLAARFTARQTEIAVASWHFDSEEETAGWSISSGATWSLQETYDDVPAFSTVNPTSKYSLYHPYDRNEVQDLAISPAVEIPSDATLNFWAVFNPVWLVYANLQVYIVEGESVKLVWDAFRVAQDQAMEDTKWAQYSVNLSEYAGKTIEFAFVYDGTYGDPVMVDDVEVVCTNTGDDAVANIIAGESIDFIDLSRGYPISWEWSFPGAETATSTEKNPTVVYNNIGSYDVTLTVTDGNGGKNTVTRKNFINVRGIPPTAEIGVPEQAYYSPEAVLVVPVGVDLTFTDISTGNVESRLWKIQGADITTSTDKAVTFRYTEAGTYDLDLTVKNAAGESSTYLYQIKAGQEANAWNIAAKENTDLTTVVLGWYGYYGGTNWLDMPAFAEKFAKPLAAAEISSVNVYFAKALVSEDSADTPITVSVAKSENGLPGEVLATSQLKASELVDASETYNDPTVFSFGAPVNVADEFFVTIAGFPNADGDDIAMYLARRASDDRNTAYHQVVVMDEENKPTGELQWYSNDTDNGGLSFAISPRIKFVGGTSGIDGVDAGVIDPAAPVEYYNLQGLRIPADKVVPGIYVVRQGAVTKKVLVK
ncbi:PKD domain-containing protein [uncultured Muribaculum sp.]|uniref:chitobiase/beta-hexosaminidase C-terminal domain-containing protein n=1 Tax=uncultured Muribaculum sp. TaxID=1918613 RepID=UPI0025FAF3CC|nr:PKD domain-containing protein [uncultured Muribaculum sp.]